LINTPKAVIFFIVESAPKPEVKLTVDESKIKKAILSELPLTVTTYTLPREMEMYIEQVVTVFLKLLNLENLKNYIIYCIQELAVNAKKANTKRVYFIENGMDLSNPDDYRQGMENFKKTTLENITRYLQMQKNKGLYIKLIMQIRHNILNIEVRNNVTVTDTELNRIHDRLARSRQFKSMDEAFSLVLDDSEGAGLGIVILVQMLKKIGLDESCFEFKSGEKETIARISIPLDKIRVENISLLSRAVVDNVEALPQFPENILMIQKLIADPRSSMAAIARQISMDPALTADILRIVNSAQYMLVKRVDNLFDAVKMVGIRGIRNLLYSYGTQRILGGDTAEKKRLWDHCYKTAFYAYNIAKNFRKDGNLNDDAYASGILHDIGKIIFSAVRPDLLNRIQKFCLEKNIPNSVFEDLSAGINHAEIGALIAEKWNFPAAFVMAIRYHHDPVSAPDEFRDVVDCVYLANMFCEVENGNAIFDQVESATLANFGITGKSQFENLLKRFGQGFEKESGMKQR